ncbi:hypothetical protein [Robertkochia solimangrovi]|uniref:hypothetical protein n=1 Tax=Robertkochia solimangrovi TaxID=2213046 RepID=UPI00117D4F78|nr:hypothetical protein [Robertkochia solimangrovi]TRZ46150.1 hypothetical protein DMZ48_02510 [Robertkochia solimangrovi]
MPYIKEADFKFIFKYSSRKHFNYPNFHYYKNHIPILEENNIENCLKWKYLLLNTRFYYSYYYSPEVHDLQSPCIIEDEKKLLFHTDKNCEILNFKLPLIGVPDTIKFSYPTDRNKTLSCEQKLIKQRRQVRLFKLWFKEYYDLYFNNTEEFQRLLKDDWEITQKLKVFVKPMYTYATYENITSIAEVDKAIKKLVKEGQKFIDKYPDDNKFWENSRRNDLRGIKIIYARDYKIPNHLSNFLFRKSDDYLEPITDLIFQYHRLCYNPELSLDLELLEKLNFHPCPVCDGSATRSDLIDLMLTDDIEDPTDHLPF